MEHFRQYIESLTDNFLDSPEKTLNRVMTPGDLKSEMAIKLPRTPQSNENIKEFIESYLKFSVNTNSPHYANQLWSKVSEPSVLGEYLAAISNTSMYTYEVAPVATLLEHEILNYLTNLVWNETTEGVMTSGGTASNLQALMIARNLKLAGVKDQGLYKQEKQPVFLSASNAHYSIKRAANLLGLGHAGFLEVPVDTDGVMTAQAVEEVLKNNPEVNAFALVSTAGTTIEGSYDNLNELAETAKAHNMWFHVDGAYGASVLLSEKHRELMAGIEMADSLSWDFHKMLGLNLPCAFLLTKQKGVLTSTLTSGNDSYLFHDDDTLDLGPKSLQCGRRNDVVKLWLSLMSYGMNGLGKRVERLFDLSKEFASLVESEKSLSLISKPQSINICFRYQDGADLIKKARERLSETSQLMINYSSDKNGDFFRLAVTNPELSTTHLKEMVQQIIEIRSGIA